MENIVTDFSTSTWI